MNIQTYIFGTLQQGYSQFPDDYTRDIFQRMYTGAKAQSQLAIHRDGELMYYSYIRNLEDDKYIGFCSIINGWYVTELDQFWTVFDSLLDKMAGKCYLVKYDPDGKIVSATDYVYENQDEIDIVSEPVSKLFGKLEKKMEKLPPVSYATSKESQKTFTIDDDPKAIVHSSYSKSYTYLLNISGRDKIQLADYMTIIRKKDMEIEQLRLVQEQLASKTSPARGGNRHFALWMMPVIGVVAFLLGMLVPSGDKKNEVSAIDMGEYAYFGQIEDGKPTGRGVAIYRSDDGYGRKLYYGNFVNGMRTDKDAVLIYNDGSYYSGAMDNGIFVNGFFYDSEHSLFVGSFKDNLPWNGNWYKCDVEQQLIEGR